ncbi:hypothetical protein D5018_09970 [Parashewanella curva]|uniref:Aerotolerance regulator N-terminal domain-containing protein n=1 Tax=Parashewanella curva TaxID=2338552 RepID=A0A3L8PWQ8_9GAMM|nr:BatA domain-containing protein [Parashewanella curva]RLV59887.1 hypothetical protein D5018_09970 [Parashewanella curva]
MNFINLSPSLVIAGLVAIAGLLFALQQLRTRYRTVVVPTSMFWQQAAQDAPVRVFRQKFKHLLAYLLTLLIASLLWLGFSEPEVNKEASNEYYVLYLDGSAAMTQGDHFEQAVSVLENDLASLPANRREVIFGGEFHTKILNESEQLAVLEPRLAKVSPQAVPDSFAEQLTLLSQRFNDNTPVNVIVYGKSALPASLQDNISVSHATSFEETENNAGLVNLGINLAASGKANLIDVLVEAKTNTESEVKLADLEFLVGEAFFTPDQIQELGKGKFVLRDVPLVGEQFTARLKNSDAFMIDDSASIALPKSSIVNVAVSSTVHNSVFAVVNSDPSVRMVGAEDADVVIRHVGENFGNQLPALEFSQMSNQTPAFKLFYQGDKSTEQALADSLHELALDQIDANGLATASSQPISVELSHAATPSVQVWNALLQPEFNFTQSKSYPVFIAQSIRWLSGRHGWQPYLSAGQNVYHQDGLYALSSMQSRFEQSLNGSLYLGKAGGIELAGQRAFVSLTNADVTTATADSTEYSVGSVNSVLSNFSEFITLLISLILLLLIAEWVVYQRGLMP